MAKDQVNEKYKESNGKKWDGGKLDYSLLPWDVIETVVVRYTAGKEKYSAWNWTQLDDAKDRYEAAMLRHFVEYKKGNRWDDDPNFGEKRPSTHLQAALWNLFALVWFELRDIEKENNDKKK